MRPGPTSRRPRKLLLETLESRVLYSAVPTVAIDAPGAIDVGETAQVSVAFDNTSATLTDAGFGPWIDVFIDRTGTDGIADPANPSNPNAGDTNEVADPGDFFDGFDLVAGSPQYLGVDVNHQLITLDDTANGGQGVLHPFAVDASGNPIFISTTDNSSPYFADLNGAYTSGDQLLVIELPFGSFTPDQPEAEVTFSLDLSDHADVGVPLTLKALGGFRFGNDPLNNPTTDPSIIGTANTATSNIGIDLARLNKTYNGPENETATGENFLRSYTINLNIADGQTLSSVNLFDELPDELQFTQILSVVQNGSAITEGAGPNQYQIIQTPPTATTGGTLQIAFNSDTVGGSETSVTVEFFAPRVFDADQDGTTNEAVLLAANSGADVLVDNQAYGFGEWSPIDPRDTGNIVGFNVDAGFDGTDLTTAANTAAPDAPAEHNNLELSPLVVQKNFFTVVNAGASGNTPGDILEYTLDFQVSDFFAVEDIVLDDLLSDGLRFDDSFVPLLEINGNTYVLNPVAVNAANYTVNQNFTGAVAGAPSSAFTVASNSTVTSVTSATEIQVNLARQIAAGQTFSIDGVTYRVASTTVGANGGTGNIILDTTWTNAAFAAGVTAGDAVRDGRTELQFRVSDEMILLGQDGRLIGGGIDPSDTATLPANDLSGYDDGPTTGRITYRAVILDQFVDNFPSGEASLNPRDRLDNSVDITANLIDLQSGDGTRANLTAFPGPVTTTDDSSESLSIQLDEVEKTIFAVNGDTNLAIFQDTNGNVNLQPGDVVTYRFEFPISSGDIENLRFTDFLPLPVFDVDDVNADGVQGGIGEWSFDDNTADVSISNFNPGVITYGPNHTLHTVTDPANPVPTLTIDSAANSFRVQWEDFVNTVNDQKVIDILVSATVNNDPFADGLFLTNQVQSGEGNTQSPDTESLANAIIQIVLNQPDVTLHKGVVATTQGGAVAATGGLTFDAIGAGADNFTGTLTGLTNAQAIGALNLDDTTPIDGGDQVRYALVAFNEGRSDAFDVRVRDTLADSFVNNYATTSDFLTQANLQVLRGDGTVLNNGVDVDEFVRTASTADIASFTNTSRLIDGVALQNGDLVLLKDQAPDAENGIYQVSNVNETADTMDLTLVAGSFSSVAVAGGNNAANVRFTGSVGGAWSADGTAATYDYFARYDTASATFDVVLSDNYSADNLPGDNKEGGISRGLDPSTGGDITNGSNAVVFLYDLTVDTDAQASSQVTNTAVLTNFAGEDGAGDHTPDDEEESASVVISSPAFTKNLVDTEVDETGNDNTEAVIGELITYELVVTAPEGTTSNAQIVDTMDPGLSFVEIVSVTPSAGVSLGNAISTGANPSNVTIADASGGTANQLTFSLGDITNSDTDNGTTDTITITYTAVVNNTNSVPSSPGNQSGTQLDNDATLSWEWVNDPDDPALANPEGNDSLNASAALVTVVEPVLNIDKQVSDDNVTYSNNLTGVDAGDTIFYRLQISNPAGGPTAFDIDLTEAIPTELTGLSVTSVNASGTGSVSVTDGGPDTLDISDFAFTGNTLGLAGGRNIDIGPDATLEIIVQGTLDVSVNPDQDIDNTASVTWTSLDGTPGQRSTHNPDSTERTGADGEGTDATTLNNYADSDDARVTIDVFSNTKSIVRTSEDFTTTVSGTERVAIGEIVRYRLEAEIPEGTSPDLQILDRLPSGMVFINDGTANVAFLTATAGAVTSTSVSDPTAFVVGTNPAAVVPTFSLADSLVSRNSGNDNDNYDSGTNVRFKLGDVVNNDTTNADTEYVIIEFNALVLNTANTGNQTGTTLSNDFRTQINGTQTVGNTPNVDVTVAEANLNVSKTTTETGPVDAGDTFDYTITITNDSDTQFGNNAAPAFDVRIRDILDEVLTGNPTTELELVTPPTGTGGSYTGNDVATTLPGGTTVLANASNNSGIDLTFNRLDAGDSITLTVSVRVVTGALSGAEIENEAEVTYTSLPGTSGTENGTLAATYGTTDVDLNPGTDSILADADANSGVNLSTIATERDGSDIGNPANNNHPNDDSIRNNYAVASSTSLSMAVPSIDKIFQDGTLSADDTTVASSTGSDVVIGEQITYDILVTLAEGVTQDVRVQDIVPEGLRVDSFTIITDGSASLAPVAFDGSFATTPSPATPVTDTTLTFDFDDITVNVGAVAANANSFVIRVTATATNILPNQQNVTRTNTARLVFSDPDGSGDGSDTAQDVTINDPDGGPEVTIVEPTVTVAKSSNLPAGLPLDAGDAIDYTITLTNTSGQTAYEVTVSDPIDSNLDVTAGLIGTLPNSSVTYNGGATGGANDFEIADLGGGNFTLRTVGGADVDLPDGGSITITFRGVVTEDVPPATDINNTANVRWSSLPGGLDGDDAGTDDERTGSDVADTAPTSLDQTDTGGPANNYAISSTIVTDSVNDIGVIKEVIDTSLDNDGAGGTNDDEATMGEVVTYRMTVTVPEGVSPDLRIRDEIPAGMAYIDGSVSIDTTGFGVVGAVTLDSVDPTSGTAFGNGQDIIFDFASIENDDDNNTANNSFTFTYQTVVLDVGSNDGLGGTTTDLTNSADHNNADGTTNFDSPVTGTPTVDVVEPELNIAKTRSVATGDAGDPVTYTLTIDHTANSNSDAFDLDITDTLPSEFTPTGFTATISAAGDQNGNFNLAGNTFTTTGTVNLAQGQTLTIEFTGTLNTTVEPNQTITNTANLTYDSYPGDREAPGFDPNDDLGTDRQRETSDSSSVDITTPFVPEVSKTLIATSEDGSTGNDVLIGEVVRYELQVELFEGTNRGLVIQDFLPAGLQFLPEDVEILYSSDNAVTGGAVAGTYAAGSSTLISSTLVGDNDVYNDGTDVFFKFGDVVNNDNDADAEFAIVRFNALVLNTVANQEAATRDNNFGVLLDTDNNGTSGYVSVDRNGSATATGTEVANDPSNDGSGSAGLSNDVTLTIREPALTFDQVIPAGDGYDAGDTFDITYTITNNGSVPAYNIRLDDTTLPAEFDLTAINTSTTGSGTPDTSTTDLGDDEVDASLDVLEAGQTWTVTATITLRDSINPGDTYTNPADVTFTSLPGATGTASGGPADTNGIDDAGNDTGADTPGAAGTATGERTGADGVGGALNDFALADTESLNIPTPFTVTKVADVSTATIGDIVTYTVTVSVIEGTTNNIVLDDTLPPGMSFVPGSAQITNANGMTIDGFVTTTLDQTLNFVTNPGGSDATANPGDTATDSFTYTYQARVDNVAGNVGLSGSQTDLVNDLDASADDVPDEDDNQATVTVVEPDLAIDKTITTDTTGLDAGDTVTYQIVVSHSNLSTADAFDLILNDTFPAVLQGFTLDSAVVRDGVNPDIDVASTGTNQIQLAGTTLSSTGDLDLLRDTGGAGTHQELVIIVSASVPNATDVGTSFTNTATVLWSGHDAGLDGDDPGTDDERTGSDGEAGSPNNYEATDDVTANTQGVLNVSKVANVTEATIGDTITYTVTFEVAQGRTEINWTDALPAGMTLVAGTVQVGSNPDALDIANLNDSTLTGQNIIVTTTGSPADDAANTETSTFTITYDAVVNDVASNDGVTAAGDGDPQTTLTNSVTATADLNDDNDTDDPGETDTADDDVTVTEPRLVVTKTNNDTDNVVVPGQPLEYTITVSNLAANGATTDAFDIRVRDVVPSELTNISITNDGGATTDNSSGNTIDLVFDTLALDDTITITFTADVVTTPVPTTIDNNVRIFYDNQPADDDNPVDPNDPAAPADTEDRDYGATGGDEVHDQDTTPNQDTDRVTVGTFTLGDRVWYDFNGDGVQDASETGLANVTVSLLYAGNDGIFGNADDVTVGTDDTDTSGNYLFENLADGNYRVTVDPADLPDGTASIRTFDADGTGTADTADVTISGADLDTADFGYRGTGSIGDLVWLDLDSSATLNGLEKGVPGVTVDLILDADGSGTINAGDTVLGTLTTDTNGNYDFTNLLAGDYIVDVTDTGNLLTGATLTGAAGVTDPEPVTIVTGQDYNDADFGYRGVASISDFVWNDFNGDGVQDGTEPGIENVTLNLYLDINNDGLVDAGDQQIATTTTDANGLYLFDGLVGNNYVVEVDTSSASLAGGTNTFDKDDFAGANNDSVGAVDLGGNETDDGVDFGYQGDALLGDFVWFDLNGDGVQDATEPPLPGVRVFLDLNENGTYDVATDAATTTAANGSYSFTGLLPRDYDVRVDASTLPTGADGTTTFDDTGIAGTPTANGNLSPVRISAGESEDEVDFGYNGNFSVSGTSYHDFDKDSSFESGDGETGVGNVTIELIWDTNNDGVVDGGDFILGSTTTANDGTYSFGDLIEGNYLVREIQPTGFGNSENPANLEDVTLTNANITEVDFGNTTGSLSGTVYRDDNNDGDQDAGETGIANVDVTLLWSGPDGTFGAGGDDATVTIQTDASGNYTFDHTNTGGFVSGFGDTTRGLLANGLYRITEAQPAGFNDGAEQAGDTPGAATDAAGTIAGASGGRDGSDQISDIDLGIAQDATGYDFGELNPASISGNVYLDLDNDGVFDGFESGLDGVTITLTGTDDLGNVINANTTTAADGSYSFTDLRPGTYVVTETQPAAYNDGTDTLGSGFEPATGNDDGTVGADTFTSIVIANVNAANNDGTGYNFGELFDPATSKTIVSTDQTATAGSDVAVGETVRYRLTAEIPYGDLSDVVLRDLLPTGMRFTGNANVALVSSAGTQLTSSTLAAGAQATGPVAAVTPAFALPDAAVSASESANNDTYNSGTDIFFKLGNLSNTETNSGIASVVIEFDAVVVNESGVDSGDTLSNAFELQWDQTGDGDSDDPGDSVETTPPTDVDVVEPVLNLTKTTTTPGNDAGDAVVYTLQITNTGTASAFDVRVRDTLDAALQLNSATSFTVTSSDTTRGPGNDGVLAIGTEIANSSTVGNAPNTPSQLDFIIDSQAVGETITIVVNAAVDNDAAAGDAVENEASITYTSTPGNNPNERNGDDGEGGDPNDYADSDDSAEFVLATPTIDKVNPVQTEYAVGETITWTINVTVPEGVTQDLVITDTIPSGIGFTGYTLNNPNGLTFENSPSVGGGTLTSSGSLGADGDNVILNFGDVTVAGTAGTANNTFSVEISAVVLNVAENQAGDTFNNDASMTYTDPDGTDNDEGTADDNEIITVNDSDLSNDGDLTVVEPNITMAKSINAAQSNPATTGPFDAGDTVVYDISIGNNVGATTSTAFDVQIADALNADLSLVSVQVFGQAYMVIDDSATTLGAGGNVSVNISEIREGDLAVIRVTTQILTSAKAGDIIDNTADIEYTSRPGTVNDTSTFLADGSDSERTGDTTDPGGALNDYSLSNSEQFGVPTPTIDKLTPSDTTYAIGESVTFDILVTVPEGTTEDLVVTDNLPAGLVYESFSVVTTAAASGGLLTDDFAGTVDATPTVANPSGNLRTFDFGDVVASGDNDFDSNTFLLRVTARVDNIAANQGLNSQDTNPPTGAATTFSNTASLQYTDGTNGSTTVNDPTVPGDIEVVEPVLTFDKSALTPTTGLDAGDTIQYQITFENTGTSTAHDVVLSDSLPAGLTVQSIDSVAFTNSTGSEDVAVSGVGTGSLNGEFTVPVGETVTVTYTVVLDNTVTPGTDYTNDASITWSSLDGASANERDGDEGEQFDGSLNDYSESDSVTVSTETTFDLTKSADKTTATVGETITYTLDLTLNEGTTNNVVLTDTLPTNSGALQLEYVAGSAAINFATAGGSITGSVTPVVSGAQNQILTFNLGDVTVPADAAADTLSITYEVVVQNVTENQDGVTLTNTADGSANDVTSDTGNETDVDVVEPDLSIVKAITTDTTNIDAGDTVTFTITIEHTGASTADAFDLNITDSLPPELENYNLDSAEIDGTTDVSGSFSITGTSLTTTANAVDLSQGEQLVLTISGTARDANVPGTVIDNTANLTYTSTDGDNPEERDGDGGVDDYSETSNTVSATTIGALNVAKVADKTNAVIGETVTYTVTVTVAEGTTVVLLDDTLPAGLSFISGTASLTPPPAGWTINGFDTDSVDQILTVTNPGDVDDAAGLDTDTFTYTYQVVVDNEVGNQAGVSLTNDIDAAADLNNDTDTGDAGETASDDDTVVVDEPVVTVTKTVDDDTPHLGQTVTYQVDLFNEDTTNGATAHDLTIVDAIPANKLTALTNIVVTRMDMQGTAAAGDDTVISTLTAGTDYTITSSTTGYTINLASLAEDERLRITYDATITTDTTDALGADRIFGGTGTDSDTFTNTVAVDWSSLSGPDAGERIGADGPGGALNDYATGTSETVTVVGADLTVTKDDGGATAVPGSQVTYTITVTNQGTDTASDVIVTDTLPPSGIAFNPGASTSGAIQGAGTVTWNFGTILAGATETITVVLDVDDPAPANLELLTNSVEVDFNEQISGEDPTDEPGDVEDNNDDSEPTPLSAQPILEITKDDGVVDVLPGDNLTYTITVTNSGNQNAIVDIRDAFPENNLTFVNASNANGVPVDTITFPGDLFWDDVVLNAGVTLNLTVNVIVTDPQPIVVDQFTNTITVTDTNPDNPAPPDTDDDTDDLIAFPDMVVVKDDGITQVEPGQEVTYELIVSNIGDQNATGVVVVDTLPEEAIFVSSTGGVDGGVYNAADHTVTWTFADPFIGDNQQTETLTLVVRVSDNVGFGQFINRVEVFDDGTNGPDLNPSNNNDEDIDSVFLFAYDGSSPDFREFKAFFRGENEEDDRWYLVDPPQFREPLLPLMPIYSGHAEPGTTLVIRLFNSQGDEIGQQTVIADAGGNWIATFPNSIIYDTPHEATIEQTSANYSQDSGRGFNLRTYFAPALNQGHFFLEDLSVDQVFRKRTSDVLDNAYQADTSPIGMNWEENYYEFLGSQSTPAGM